MSSCPRVVDLSSREPDPLPNREGSLVIVRTTFRSSDTRPLLQSG